MASRSRPSTVGSLNFDPDTFFETWGKLDRSFPSNLNLQSAITAWFGLKEKGNYVYHAIASVTLSQVQQAIEYGGQARLHAWYLDESGKLLPPPPATDITAYTLVFASTTSTPKSLTGLASNAEKGSLRAHVAAHLTLLRVLPAHFTIRKLKTPHLIPYYDFWSWSCQNLEWTGPTPGTANVKTSHYILSVFMHHFGCVVPSYEGLEVIKQISQKRAFVEIGSGNGYWAYMLRSQRVSVIAVDKGESQYRTLWIGDTIFMDGEKYLKKEHGARDSVLLLVYPIVGSNFTGRVLSTYEGTTVCVAGTQNSSGYTAFKDTTIDHYIASEMPDFRKTVQIPLPSFAGKDEALFVFEHGVEGGA